MTGPSNPPRSPPPLLQTKSSPPPNQHFHTLRPPVSTTPSRDGRSRSTATLPRADSTQNPISLKPETLTYDNFNNVMAQRVQDPLYTDLLARSNRVTTSLTQHVSTLNVYSKQFSEMEDRQQTLLSEVRDANATLERTAHSNLDAALPEIRAQNKTIEKIEDRVAQAQDKLVGQHDMLAEIDTKIAENRKMLSLPPPSLHIISAPSLHSRENSQELSPEHSNSVTTESEQRKCRII